MQTEEMKHLMKTIPKSELWRFVIHGYRHNEGPNCFEDEEANYLPNMLEGFNFILKTSDAPLTVDYLIQTHDIAISNTQYRYKALLPGGQVEEYLEPLPKGIRTGYGTEFGLVAEGEISNISEKGLVELLQKIANGDNYFTIDSPPNNCPFKHPLIIEDISTSLCQNIMTKLKSKPHRISIKATTENELKNRLNAIIANFNKAIKLATDNKQKTIAIINCIHDLELTHPFADGNCRSIVILLLNKLLMQHNLHPVILNNPDCFDAYSIDELYNEIINSQITKKEDIFRFSSNTINPAPSALSTGGHFMRHAKKENTAKKKLISKILDSYVEHLNGFSTISIRKKSWRDHYHAGKINEEEALAINNKFYQALQLIPRISMLQNKENIFEVSQLLSINHDILATKLCEVMQTFIHSKELAARNIKIDRTQHEELLLQAFNDEIKAITPQISLNNDDLQGILKSIPVPYNEHFENYSPMIEMTK